jgi:hypothetical protein
MNELTLENITNTKCVKCNDLLTDWEENVCIMCEEYEIV